MLTVGKILKEARLKKGISLEEAEEATRIRKKYLFALEKNEYDSLPGQTYIAGFINNYSRYLGLKPQQVLPVFRREFTGVKKSSVLPGGLARPLASSFSVSPRLAAMSASIILLCIFFLYLFIEYRFVAVAPHLSLDNPIENQTIGEKSAAVVGRSDPDADVSINNQNVMLQVDGSFSADVGLRPGKNTITVVATNKFGKRAQIIRTVFASAP